jgi:hypothetical protein
MLLTLEVWWLLSDGWLQRCYIVVLSDSNMMSQLLAELEVFAPWQHCLVCNKKQVSLPGVHCGAHVGFQRQPCGALRSVLCMPAACQAMPTAVWSNTCLDHCAS